MDNDLVQNFEMHNQGEIRESSRLIDEMRLIWKKLGLKYPNKGITREYADQDGNIKSASEIINNYDKDSFRQFIRERLYKIAGQYTEQENFIPQENHYNQHENIFGTDLNNLEENNLETINALEEENNLETVEEALPIKPSLRFKPKVPKLKDFLKNEKPKTKPLVTHFLKDTNTDIISDNSQINRQENGPHLSYDDIDKLEDEEIDEWYEIIQSFVGQLKQFLRSNDLDENSLTPQNVAYSIAEINYTNFQALFNEHYNKYCDPTSIESRNSPVAYLTFIFQLALDIESFSTPNSLKLKNRRPDLFELVLNEENTYTEVKTIILVNEILKSGIQNYLDSHSTDKNIYSILAKTLYPFLLPINFYYEGIKYAFLDKKSSIRELKETFDFNEYINGEKLYSGVPVSTEQMEVLLDYTPDNLKKYFKVNDIKELKQFRFFLEKAQMTSQELQSIVETKLSTVKINSTDPKNLTILNLTEVNLFKIHKAICLNRWFGISLKDSFILIHHILKGLNTDKLTKQAIHSVEYFDHLKNKYDVSLKDYISFINEIPNSSIDSEENSYFDEIFNKERKTFTLDGTEYDHDISDNKDSAIVLDLARALGLPMNLFQYLADEITKSKGSALKKTLSDTSILYRITRLAKIFGINIIQFLSICRLLKYKLDIDLRDHQKIYAIETFCNWMLSAEISATFIESIIEPVPSNLMGSEGIFNFIIEINKEIAALDDMINIPNGQNITEEEIDQIAQYKENKIFELFLTSLGINYTVERNKIEYICAISKIDINAMITETINLKDIESIDQITLSYSQLHYTLNKYCALVEGLDLSAECLKTFILHPKSFGVKNTTLTLKSFYALWTYSKVARFQTKVEFNEREQGYVITKDKYNVEEGLLTLLNTSANQTATRTNIIVNITEINEKEIKDASTVIGNITTPQQIYTLYKLKLLSKKLDLPIKSLIKLNSLKDDSKFEIVKKIFQETIVGYFDSFEKKQRDILVDFYLNHVVPNSFPDLIDNIKTPNDLYECLLIDNQISTEVVTSRVSSAIASIQQFINGAVIGIEPGQNVPAKIADNWLQNNSEYAIWAANVMLFLYPANYIDPSLRQNKSDLFSKLENTLSQAGLSEEKVQSAVLTFLNDFEKVADLRTVSCYCHGAKKNSRKTLTWAQNLVREKKVYYYNKVNDGVWKEPGGYDNSIKSGMFYSIAISSKNWILGKLSDPNSSNFAWIEKSKLQDKGLNNDQKYSVIDNLEINKYIETFNLLDSTFYLISETKYTPTEYYLRTVDMSQSLDGTPNPLAWSDYYKIELPLANLIPGSIRPVLFSNRIYIMYGEIGYTSKKETTSSGATQESKIEHLNMMLGYRTFDGTWSTPQKIGSVIIDTTKFSLQKSIAYSVKDEKCILALIGNNNSIIKSIDKVMTISDLSNAIFMDSSHSITKVSNLYSGNKIQNSLTSINSDSSEIMNITMEWHADGDIGIAQYIKYDPSQFLNYRPIRLNTSFVTTLIARTNLSIFNLLTWDTQVTREPQIPGGESYPMVDFNGANGKYFWELFFHLPFMIANRFKNERNYKDAIVWMKIMFDPTAKNKSNGSPNYWNTRILIEKGSETQAVHRPADPDALAASNPVEYKKALFYLLLDIIIAEADENYRMLTPDSLNRAKQLYIQLLALLGDRPDIQLVKMWMPTTLQEAIGFQNNALIEIENALMMGDIELIDNPALRTSVSLLLEKMDWMSAGEDIRSMFSSIFRVPLNTKLLGYWDLIESRLFNLRHNLSITGSLLSLGLFASPMDPKDLLKARENGGSSPLAVSRLNTKVPPYKFRTIIEQARSAVGTFSMYGDKLLGYIETKEGKTEIEVDIGLAIEMSNYTINLQEQSAKILQEERKSLQITKSIYEQEYNYNKKHYDENLSHLEKNAIILRTTASVLDVVSMGHKGHSALSEVAPTIFGVAFGGQQVGAPLKALGIFINAATTKMHQVANGLDQGASYQRRREQWEHGYKSAEKQIAQIDNSLAVHELQMKSSSYSIEQSKREQDNMKKRYNFLRKKFTNKELYEWLVGQTSILYLQMYEVALDMALAAEACYRFESGEYYMKFIQPSGFNNVYRGLNCGEMLRVGLERMASSRWRKYEKFLDTERDIFLSELFGDEWDNKLNELKQTGEIFFSFPEELFSKDQPGQYYRQISNMSFTMENPEKEQRFDSFPNWVVPIYTQARLTQTFNALVHVDDIATFNYVVGGRKGAKPDSKSYLENMRSGQSVNISQKYLDLLGQASADGERYLPFEGTGLISEWHLVFTNEETRKADLEDLFDIRFRIKYTSVMGSRSYEDHVKKTLNDMKKK